MEKKLLRTRQKIQTINRTIILVAGFSLAGLFTYFAVFVDTINTDKSKAGIIENMMMGYSLNPGEIIMAFDFESGDLLKSMHGVDATNVSAEAILNTGGTDNTIGLGPGKTNKSFFFELPAVKELNLGGVDVSLDYRYSNKNCGFFSRGKSFEFGIKNSKIFISYTLINNTSEPIQVMDITSFVIPDDDLYRNYRFHYDPVSGHAEIIVNNITIWSHDHPERMSIKWNEKESMLVGKNMKSNDAKKVFIDNVILKATRQISDLPITLLNFEAKAENDYIMVQWYTLKEIEIDSFIVERSTDAVHFTEIGRVKASGSSNTLLAYALVDSKPLMGLVYYRLMPSNKPVKSVTIPLIGYKYRGEGKDIKLVDVVDSSRAGY
jgi:hypothetical protein